MSIPKYIKRRPKDGNDKRIKKKEFYVRQQVLLFNSMMQLHPIKFKSR